VSDLYGVPRRRIVGETAFWITIVLAAVVILTLLGLGWRYILADPKGKVQAQEQIKSGPSRIAAYNHFFDLCASVQSDEAAITSLNQELTTGPSESRRGQIQASLTALRSARAEKINQYNADARKDYTIGQFRSLGLPYTLEPTSEATRCVA
jgi:hypothetical protein